MSSPKRAKRLFEAFFAFGVCLALYGLVMVGSVWAPLYVGGPQFRPLVAYALMPLDLLMLGWNQPWRLLALHLLTMAASFALARSSTTRQFKLMLLSFITCALAAALNDAFRAYRGAGAAAR